MDALRSRLLLLAQEKDGSFAAACSTISGEELTEILHRYESVRSGLNKLVERLAVEVQKKTTAGKRISGLLPDWIAVDYYERGKVRIVGQAVSPRKYLELYKNGWLAYQIDNTERPSELPDPETLKAKAAAD